MLLSAELGWTGAVCEGTWTEPEDVRRRHGRSAVDGVQRQAQVKAQRHRQLRNLGAFAEIDGSGQSVLCEISGTRQGRRCRSARLLSGRVGLRGLPVDR